MTTSACTRCSTPVDAQAVFCGGCGRSTSSAPVAVPVREATPAARTAVEPGAVGTRIAANLVDGVVVTAIQVAALALFFLGLGVFADVGPVEVALIGAVVVLVPVVWLFVHAGRTGRTPGKAAMGLRIVSYTDGGPPGIGRFVLRQVVGTVLNSFLLLGAFSVLLDGSGQNRGWYDRAAGTMVLDVRRGRDPFRDGDSTGADEPAATVEAPARGIATVGSPLVPSWTPRTEAPSMPPVAPAPVALPTPTAGSPTPPPAAPRRDGTPSRAVPAPVGLITGIPGRDAPAPAHATPSVGAPAVLAEDVESTRISRRTTAAPTTVVLHLDDGRAVPVRRTALLGRNPAAATDEVIDDLVPIEDDTRTVSKTHVEIAVVDGQVWVRDRHSTNGTAVVLDAGGEHAVGTESGVLVAPGSTVRFGDRTFRLEQR